MINTQTGTDISFHALENRKPNIKVFLTVDSPSGRPIINYSYAHNFNSSNIEIGGADAPAPLILGGAQLPYEGDVKIHWDGKLADGSYPEDGPHKLYLQIMDADKNYSEVASVDFLRNFNISYVE